MRPAGKAAALAEENKIEIRLYTIIYNAVDDVKRAMEGLLPPTLVEKPHGKAEVRQIFKIKGVVVAGCIRHRRARSSAAATRASSATASWSGTARSARSSASRTT